MSRTPEQEKTCEASGRFTSSDPLVAFLYDLMKSHLPTGVVAQLVYGAVATRGGPCEYTNGWLAQYAAHLSATLRGPAASSLAPRQAAPHTPSPEETKAQGPDCECGHTEAEHLEPYGFNVSRACAADGGCDCLHYSPPDAAREPECNCGDPECGGCYPSQRSAPGFRTKVALT